LFGGNPHDFFRNSYIALARYKGKMEGVERLDYKEFFGDLFHQIDECDKYIEELGEGWNKIIDEHKNHPLKPKLPKIISDKYSILVILYSVGEKFEKTTTELNERQKKKQ
jgi:predicted HTH transcriptional regulator